MSQQIDPLRAQVLAQKKTISALKQEIDRSQKGVGKIAKSSSKAALVKADSSEVGKPSRHSGALLRELRERLGLSREAFAPLIGASKQAIFNWEQTEPRPQQQLLDKIALIRHLRKNQIHELLEQHSLDKPVKRNTTKTVPKNGP